ncbi:MCE family protein [Nocardioides halotolerans]|uniref:MCE family protein n=1 Tax=Nocardioides halotolerans TaxID=433660 RepID=UPI0004019FCE|nr:MCE family protein [Nocardioides halotolerans]
MTARKALTVLLVAVLAVVTGSCVPDAPGGPRHLTVTAYFTDSAGLFTGNDVGILGVPVGKVTDIEPDGDRVKVTLELETDQPVPADVGAVVVARSVATDRYIELTPVYDGGPRLRDGATIAVDATRTPVDFDQVLATIDEFATGIAGSKETTKAIRRFVEAGDAAFSGQGPQLQETITTLSQAATDVSAQRGEIVATLDSLDRLVAAINGNEQTVRKFLRRVAQGSALLDDQRTEFRDSLRALDRAVHTVAAFAVKNKRQLVKAMNGSADVMDALLAKQQQLAEVLEVMPLALQNLERTNDHGRVPMRIDPTILSPLGGQLSDVCPSLPAHLCDLVLGTDPQVPRSVAQVQRGWW